MPQGTCRKRRATSQLMGGSREVGGWGGQGVCTGGTGQGVCTPLKNHKTIGFFSNTGPDSLKNHKGIKPVFNFWAIIGTQGKCQAPFKWRFAGSTI